MNQRAVYSLVAPCEANGVNPLDYLRDVLRRVQNHSAAEIDDLLPHRWRPPADHRGLRELNPRSPNV